MSMYLQILILLFIYFLVFYIIAMIMKNNSIVDIGWGLGFAVAAIFGLVSSGEYDISSIVISAAVSVWGFRLFYHILRRNLGKPEDYRYVNMKRKWKGKKPAMQAFFKVFMLQMVFMYIISLPVTAANSVLKKGVSGFLVIGMVIWAIGFIFEVTGDRQLRAFKRNPENKGKIMTVGLWKFTRHPNYFGESVMWTGIFIASVPSGLFYLTILSPVTITLLLLFVSGVPLLEKRYEGNTEYEAYKKKTNAFFPWFPKGE